MPSPEGERGGMLARQGPLHAQQQFLDVLLSLAQSLAVLQRQVALPHRAHRPSRLVVMRADGGDGVRMLRQEPLLSFDDQPEKAWHVIVIVRVWVRGRARV